MELTLKNIGKVKEANVIIDGITVIAGENNTGKSTVGKVLFSVFNSFYGVNEQINREKIQSVARTVDNILFDNTSRIAPTRIYSNAIAEYIVENTYSNTDEESTFESIVKGAIDQYNEKFDENIEIPSVSENFAMRLEEILGVQDEEIFESIFANRLNDEFNGQINNIYSKDAGEINLTIKDTWVLIKMKDEGFLSISSILDLKTEAVYIDDPFVIDEIRPLPNIARPRQLYDHRSHLKNKLQKDLSGTSIINEIITTNKFDIIFEKIGLDLEMANFRSRLPILKTKRIGEDKSLVIKNLSTGIKTFLIIKTLLKNGTIEQNGTIILDEPEIHLHPEWQLLFAELIVLIQKEFGMHILLNTHSPYFLRAIQVYSNKHSIDDKCKYYLAENVGDFANITDVSNDIEKIYRKLSQPLQTLENERWRDD